MFVCVLVRVFSCVCVGRCLCVCVGVCVCVWSVAMFDYDVLLQGCYLTACSHVYVV